MKNSVRKSALAITFLNSISFQKMVKVLFRWKTKHKQFSFFSAWIPPTNYKNFQTENPQNLWKSAKIPIFPNVNGHKSNAVKVNPRVSQADAGYFEDKALLFGFFQLNLFPFWHFMSKEDHIWFGYLKCGSIWRERWNQKLACTQNVMSNPQHDLRGSCGVASRPFLNVCR